MSDKSSRLEKDNTRLRDERKTLEATIKELQSLQETFVDMEDKLKDLQCKLKGEDAAKKELSVKYDEVRLDQLALSQQPSNTHCRFEGSIEV